MRRIFVGDIQGCREELERLLERVRFDPSRDELHPCGDLVNRGPDNVGTLRLLVSLKAGGVLGNHDRHLLRVADGERGFSQRDTIHDVLRAPDREALLAFVASRPLIRAWADIVLVHAGLNPAWTDPMSRLDAHQPRNHHVDVDFVTCVRHCDALGQRPGSDDPPPGAPFRPWFEHPRAPILQGRTVVFGHWATLGLVVAPGLRGLDTGCVWGRELTAWIAEEDRLVSVPRRSPSSRAPQPG